MKKRIHIIVKFFMPVTAGIETNIMETYSVLADNGWDITLHTTNDTHMEKNVLQPIDEIRGLHIRRYPFKKYSYTPSASIFNTDIIALHNFDMFPHMFVMLSSLMLKLFHKKRFSLILTPHGGYTPEWRTFSKVSTFIKRSYHISLGKFLINASVDAVRCVSEWEKQEMIRHGIKESLIQVITNGLEDEAYKPVERLVSKDFKRKISSYGDYIIQIGRIYPIKNYETVIRALPLIPSRVNYVIAGSSQNNDAYRTSLIKLAKELGVEKRVIFSGVVRGVDKYYLIKKSQLMVHMAIWESYCNVVHEGMSQGKIIIAANNTALPLLVKNGINGYIIDTFDHSSLAKKINYILNHKNKKVIVTMQDNNKKFTKDNSWKHVAYLVEKLYLAILNTTQITTRDMSAYQDIVSEI